MALSAGRDTAELAQGGRKLILPVAAKAVIFEGAMVAVNADGYAIPAAAAEELKAAGRADTYANNKNGANGAVNVEVVRGAFLWDNSGSNPLSREHVLGDCYIEDDHTVTADPTGSSVAGKVISVSGEGVAVDMR